jgi:cyclic beta-1,2-glucan synthetase
LYGWLFSNVAWFWTLAVAFIVGLPAAVILCWNLIWKPKDVLFTQHVIYTAKAAKDHFAQHAIDFIFLPYEAITNIDAIFRTAWRMWISHKKLLEWNPSGICFETINGIAGTARTMWFVPLVAVGALLLFHQVFSAGFNICAARTGAVVPLAGYLMVDQQNSNSEKW